MYFSAIHCKKCMVVLYVGVEEIVDACFLTLGVDVCRK